MKEDGKSEYETRVSLKVNTTRQLYRNRGGWFYKYLYVISQLSFAKFILEEKEMLYVCTTSIKRGYVDEARIWFLVRSNKV